MQPCIHLDLLDISQYLFPTTIFIVSSNAMNKLRMIHEHVAHLIPYKHVLIYTLHIKWIGH